jgi:hypothetical protein
MFPLELFKTWQWKMPMIFFAAVFPREELIKGDDWRFNS